MLNFQNQDCNTSLQEGIDEYRSYLRINNRYVLGEQVSDSEKWGILCHDATHVIFGLDTTLEEEAMLDCWVFFGGNYFQILKDYFSGKINFKETTEKVEILLKVTSIKNMCISTGIDLLKIGYSRILIGFHENKFSNPKALMEFIKKNKNFIKVKDDKIVITKSFSNDHKKLDFIITEKKII